MDTTDALQKNILAEHITQRRHGGICEIYPAIFRNI